MLFFETSTYIFVIKGLYCSISCCTRYNILIHLVFTFRSNLFPFYMNTSHSFWNSRYFLGEWEKNVDIVWTKASNWATQPSFESTNTTKFVQWAKQCTPIKHATTISFIWIITPILEPWKTLLPFVPMEMNLHPNTSTLTPTRVSKALNMNWNTLSIIPCTSTISTQIEEGFVSKIEQHKREERYMMHYL